MKNFHDWMNEVADFGFESTFKDRKGLTPYEDDPIHHLDVGYVISQLKKHKVGLNEANRSYFSEVVWGKGIGSIKLEFTPLGGSRVMIRKLCHDLHGDTKWILKKVIEIRHLYDHHPDVLVENSLNIINELSQQGNDSPSNEYKDLEKLVLRMTPKLRGTRMDLFIYEGTKKVKENENYIIHFGVTGNGVQKKDQRRLEQFQFHVLYKKEVGLIKIIGQEIDSSLGQHQWKLDQSSWIEYFMPSQSFEEIIETQVRLFNSY